MSFINTLLKIFLGDKNTKDLKNLSKLVEQVHDFEPKLSALSNDDLRNKTQAFKQAIASATEQETKDLQNLQNKAKEEQDVEIKEKHYKSIEELNQRIYQKQEKTLQVIMPEAFALMKETAKRFAQNAPLKVSATDKDQLFANQYDFVDLINSKTALYKNTWDAAGNSVLWDMVYYDVQLIGGGALHSGKIAEMATGEGKTLVSTLALYLNALPGRGVHLVTVNDYLARRDAAWMRPLFAFHGLTSDCIDLHQPNSQARIDAYAADITYGTNNEFGFDYLRDNMVHNEDEMVQRPLNYAIIDEVDSVLIDDARTPLIISGAVSRPKNQEFDVLKPLIQNLVNIQKALLTQTLQQARTLIQSNDKKDGGFKLFQVYRGLPKLKPLIKYLSESGIRKQLQKTESFYMQDNNREMHKVDEDLYFVIDEKNNSVDLTEKGLTYLSQKVKDDHFFIMPDLSTALAKVDRENTDAQTIGRLKDEIYLDFSVKSERIHTISQLLKAYTLFERDKEYVVMDGQVKIVDEQTGRIMDGRRYSDGLHQALEAKEDVKIEAATQTYATITLQNYFRMYNKLAGMTGTAETEASELWQIYKLDVMAIPTNKPIIRADKQDLVYKTEREKYKAVIEQIELLSQKEKRPVLVGTTSVEVSELLSRMLKMRGIRHNVLNAKLHQKEAEIVAEAGKPSSVTIATNMAGRGTDIKLTEAVRDAGGLAIIGTERHESRRVDRQLRGRAGRQGDPGSSQFYVSLEDNLMRLFGSDRMASVMDRMGHKEGDVIQHSLISNSIERAQRKVEENNFGVRKRLLQYDDVMNKQREVIYKRRKNALSGDRVSIDILDMVYDLALEIVQNNKAQEDYKNFDYEVIKYFALQNPIDEDAFRKNNQNKLIDLLYKAAYTHYKDKEKQIAQVAFPFIEMVYKSPEKYNRLQFPFADATSLITISTDLEKAYNSKGLQVVRDFEKYVILSNIDHLWQDHLREMDELKRSVQNASYEQKDPLLVYKQESYYLFSNMMQRLNKKSLSTLFIGYLPTQLDRADEQSLAQLNRQAELLERAERPKLAVKKQLFANSGQDVVLQTSKPANAGRKIGRNDVVSIRNVATGQVEQLKFKQAQPKIDSGAWILLDA